MDASFRYSGDIVIRKLPNCSVGSRWRLLVGLLCLALVVACGTIQVIHAHVSGDVSDSTCSLCATAHVVMHVAEPVYAPVAARVLSLVEVVTPAGRAHGLSVFALFTRPPPVDCVLS